MNATPPSGGWLARACQFLELVTMCLLGAVTILILIQIAARDIAGVGAPWAEELARYCGLGLVYLALPWLLLHDKHIHVDLFVSRLKGMPARALRVANELLTLTFCVLFLWGGWAFMQRAARFSTAALGIPNWIYYLPAFVGMFFFLLVSLLRLQRALRGEPLGNAS
jgi:TRAP-type C4-dicarboxylate transport system permease small subunit